MTENQEKRRLRDEVAELAQAVRELREQLAQRQNHICCPGACCHYYVPVPYVPVPYVPYVQPTWTITITNTPALTS